MAGKNSSASLPLSRSIPNNSNLISTIQPEANLDLVDFPPLNSSSSAGANPSSGLVNGGEENGSGSGSHQQSKGLNWLKGLNKPKDPVASIKLTFNDSQEIDGTSAAVFDSGELKTHIHNCDSYVVGYFVGRRPSFPVVEKSLKSLWKTKGEFSMTIYGQQVFFFNFVLEEDRDGVLEMGFVHIEGKLFLIRPWSPFLEQKIGALSSVPIWMNLTGVPIHLWNELGFSRIASIVGKPIMTDSQTALKTRMSYARICVEVDASCTFPSVLPFYIDKVKYEARAEYPWKPKACSHCKRFGHSSTNCSSNPTVKRKVVWVPKMPANKAKDDASKGLADLNKGVVSPNLNRNSVVQGDELMVVACSDSNLPTSGTLEGEEGNVDILSQQDAEKWLTYTKRNRNANRMKNVPPQVPICNLNPYDVLFEDGQEGRDEVMREDRSFVKVVEETRMDENYREEEDSLGSRVNIATITSAVEQDQDVTCEVAREEAENVLEGTFEACEESCEDEDAIEVSEYETDVEEPIEKLKPLVEIRRKSPTKEQHMAKLMDGFSSLVKPPNSSREMEMKNIFGDITDRFKGTKADKDLGPCDEKLGRGKRTPAKKKM